MALPPSFLTSRTVRGYNPQFIDTQTPAATPGAGAPDLTNRLLQVLSGQLGGTLTGGEKLSALGALLKSVSRGSQTTPQQVLQGIQQQKLGEVQGALQIQELRKQAGQEAQRQALREDLLAKAGSEEERARIRILSGENLEKFALQRLENKAPEMETKQRQLATYYQMREEDPARASAYWRLINPTQIVGSIESGIKEYNVPEPPVAATGKMVAGGTPRGGLTDLTPPQPKPVVPTESENTAGFLYTRLQDSLGSLKNILKNDREAAIPSAGEIVTQNIFGEDIANQFKSPTRQQFIASQRDALAASLTLVTGAAYNEQQLNDEYRSYFPQYGDKPETIRFKSQKWENLLKAAKLKAGRAVQPQGQTPKPSGGQKPSGPSPIKILSIKPRG